MDISRYVVTVSATLIQTVEKIQSNRSRAVFVIDNEKVIGVVSEGDIMRALLKGINIHAPITSFLEYSFKYLTEVDLNKAFNLIKKHLFTLVPVVDNEFRLKSIITVSQILNKINLEKSDE